MPRELGTVRRFDLGHGYGFVVTDAGDCDLFLHARNLRGTIPRAGDRVEFAVERFSDGRREAVNVKVL
jgi:cold shock CspA family protein